MRLSAILIAAAFVVAVASCGGSTGSDSTAPPPPTTLYSVELDSGIVDSVSAPVGSTIPVRVRVTRTGAAANAISVTWTVSAGHGTVSANTSATDSLGIAAVSWTLGDTIGLNSITAAAGNGSAALRVVGTAGAASTLSRVTPDSSSVVASASLPITARVVDQFGNAVSGATVNWTTSGGSLSIATSVTGASGNAQTNFTTPAAPGTYTVTAALPGQATISFKIIAL